MNKIIPITLPKWGLEMSEGTVTAWHFAEGDTVKKGDELVDIETDKIVNSMEADQAGRLRRIVVPEGDVAAVGALIAVMADLAVADAEIDTFISQYVPVDAGFEPSEKTLETAEPTVAEAKDVKSTPLARRTAREAGVDIASVRGSGHKGRILREDVNKVAAPSISPEQLQAENALVKSSPIARKFANSLGLALNSLTGTGRKGRVSLKDAEDAAILQGLWSRPVHTTQRATLQSIREQSSQELPFTGMRKAIARTLVSSKQSVPHFYTTIDMQIDRLLDLRKGMNAADEVRISVNDILVLASAKALEANPGVNVHVDDAGVTQFAVADIAIAVSIEGGLIAPILRDAGSRGLRSIASATQVLTGKAHAREFSADELSGGTFTLSNLGMYGVRQFDAIITPPQGAILAVGGPRREAVERSDGSVGFATRISATLSADHRAIDGALAAKFLATLKLMIEEPGRLL